MKKASGDFVKSLRKEIEEKRKKKRYQKNLLNDSFDFVLRELQNFCGIQISSVKNYDTHELSCSATLLAEDLKLPDPLKTELEKIGISIIFKDGKKNVTAYLVDLTGKISGYRNKKNLCVIQVQPKSQKSVELKMFIKTDSLIWSVYEKNFFSLKFWISHLLTIEFQEIDITAKSRDKSKVVLDVNEKYKAEIKFNQIGEVRDVIISLKKGEKKGEQHI